MSKNMVEPERPQTIWRPRIAWWISKGKRAQAHVCVRAATHSPPPFPNTQLCNIYCFSTSTIISRARLIVTLYKVVQIWPGQTVTCLHTNSPGHIWTTLYVHCPFFILCRLITLFSVRFTTTNRFLGPFAKRRNATVSVVPYAFEKNCTPAYTGLQ
jgi:hypothetical protein